MHPVALSSAVGIGGFLGALARYGTALGANRFDTGAFPAGTFIANLLGCLAFGILRAVMERYDVPPALAAAATTGFLGAYTTFSTFSFETVTLARQGHVRLAVAYVLLSVAGGLLLAWVGYRTFASAGAAS